MYSTKADRNMLKTIIAKFKYKMQYGRKVQIGRKFRCRNAFFIAIENAGEITIGEHVFFNNACSISALGHVKIGDNCLFGENVKIYDHNHIFNLKAGLSIATQGMSVGNVKVGNNCWIGSNCILLKGAKIGDNCVIGAGCIINCEIPSNSLVRSKKELQIEEIRYTNKSIQNE